MSPPGQYLLAWEQNWLDQTVADLFGYDAVQIGCPALVGLRECRMPHRYLVLSREPSDIPKLGQPSGCAHIQPVIANPTELPFDNQSLDLVILPHVLECSASPHQVLREVERVLIPRGRLIILGLNPFSLWGAHHRLVGRRWPVWFDQQPWVGLPRLKDWLALLSFEIERGRFGCYRWPSSVISGFQRHAFFELAGDRWWPYLGAVYAVSAIKQVVGMRLVTPVWRSRVPTASRTVSVQGFEKGQHEVCGDLR